MRPQILKDAATVTLTAAQLLNLIRETLTSDEILKLLRSALHPDEEQRQKPKSDPQAPPGIKLIRRLQVLAILAINRTVLDEGVERGEIPAPIKVTASGRARAWVLDEIIAHVEARKAKRADGKDPQPEWLRRKKVARRC
jgi:predicted DNA-binding transcriptional regulator AlpA